MQNAISLIGLAVGFTCFALSAMWIHHDMTYDTRHNDAERMFLLCEHRDGNMNSAWSITFSHKVTLDLLRDFPEVEETAAHILFGANEWNGEGGATAKASMLCADSCFMRFFDIRLMEGSLDFLHDDTKVALTERTARQLFGTTENILGKKIDYGTEKSYTVCAVLTGLEHSNLDFDIWGRAENFSFIVQNPNYAMCQVLVKLHRGVDADAFRKKLQGFTRQEGNNRVLIYKNYNLVALSKYYYSEVKPDRTIKFQYLILFSIAGGLVILCSLFNYLSLFVTRIRLRSRELELRKVCGSSTVGLWLLLTVEYLLPIAASYLLGMVLMELVQGEFQRLSGIAGTLYGKSLCYFAGILLGSILLLIPFVFYYRRRRQQRNHFLLRKVTIMFQLAVGILFVFCMTILVKQLYFLRTTDLGWERQNIASLVCWKADLREELSDKLASMPCIAEVLREHCSLLPRRILNVTAVADWEGRLDSVPPLQNVSVYEDGSELVRFYGMTLLEGELLQEGETGQALVNESMVKALGLHQPLGKRFIAGAEMKEFVIKGVLKDFHLNAPTMPVPPAFVTAFSRETYAYQYWMPVIKYYPGRWKELKECVEQMFQHDYPGVGYELSNVEETYNDYLKSENLLLKLLTFVSVVCMLISVFGIFSFVTLSCEQRRKEIAVRKVNGAKVKDILTMFVREYVVMLLLASVVAFSIGYVLMKRWLESYVEQTSIAAWIYLSIFVGVALVIALCIGWRVWQAARQNPAEVVKRE